ncbi:unnamed protein product [Bursaphelenchus okinawaensis]|uniref:Uncharacterized protein n=1 Tax=Bursaphelenchus okinawaensis TaxID=465554 RepID=A0A811K468_9BILA|nr:unnamed protein product [Bursaphelenchus okinawaensis]CAG9090353.1 unnamed protein product [Bursaphelenchus okinawaensis]
MSSRLGLLCVLIVGLEHVDARFFAFTPRLEELLNNGVPKVSTGDVVALDVLLNQDGDQLAKYNSAFHQLKQLNPNAKRLILDGGFFYRFENFGEKYLDRELERTVNGLKTIVEAANSNGLSIQSFKVRLQWLMYYTISHETYGFTILVKKYFGVTVKPDDFVDFKTVLTHHNTDINIHAELQFDPRRNRHQPSGRMSENPRKGEHVADKSTTGHGHVFWLEDMAYVLANRAAMPRYPQDFVFFSPLGEFFEDPDVFYNQAVKKMGTLFSDARPVRLFGSAVIKARDNTEAEFVNEWTKVKNNIDAAVNGFNHNGYPLISVLVKVYFQYSNKV